MVLAYFARRGVRDYPTELERHLESRGYLTPDIRSATCVVFENIDKVRVSAAQGQSPHRPKVLIRTEPSVVSPYSYNPKFLAAFDLVLSMGTIEPLSGQVMGWPQEFGQRDNFSLTKFSDRLDRAVQVSGDKISFVAGELYSLRRQTNLAIPDLVLLGSGWGRGIHVKGLRAIKELLTALMERVDLSPSATRNFFRRPQNYLGIVENKLDSISSFKYSLVIENQATYVSEKVFDALFAGCIPIYVGPELKKFGFPPGLVIEVEPNISSIREGMASARGTDATKWERLRLDFLNDPATILRWKSKNVYDDVIRRLQDISNQWG